jgi:hypothetical protein
MAGAGRRTRCATVSSLLSLSLLSSLATGAAQAPAARATGRACDENGKPVAGAAVGAFGPQQFVDTQALLAHPPATTGDDGAYAIAVDPALAYGYVVVAAPRRQACALRLEDRLARDGGELAVALLVPGASLTGRVRDESGAPLAGACVSITSAIADRGIPEASLRAGAVSDGKGIFTVPCVPRTGMRLVVTCAGYLTESRLVAQETPADLTLRKVGMVRGKVVGASGKAVAGADVYAITVETHEGEGLVRSAADGAFAITVPVQGRFRVAAGLREGDSSYRQFSSGLLHGAADDVVVGETATQGPDMHAFEVVVVDAATKAPIDQFWLSQQIQIVPSSAMFHHSMRRREYHGSARLLPVARSGQTDAVVIDAPGHAFEIAPVPDDLHAPLVVALGPEAVLTGKVIDAETGLPMAGVAVRALPEGNGTGSGGTAEQAGPKSDKDGVYRVGGLKPGKYRVQVHAADRVASAPVAVTVGLDKPTTLDLTAPKRRWLEFELTGALPDGAPCRVKFGYGSMSSSSDSGYQHYLQEPPPPALMRAGKVRFGPVGGGTRSLQLFVPSRTRIGTGTTLQLGEIDPDRGSSTIALPDLDRQLVHGRVALTDHLPSERIAVAARPVAARRLAWLALWGEEPNVAGVDAGGSFVLDLPAGSYRLQLFDLLTGIAFHTEEQPVAVAKGMAPLLLQPVVHWLELDLVPALPGGEVVLQSLAVDLPRPGSELGAFLQSWGGSNDVEHGGVPFRAGALHERWLVPAAHVVIKANQTFEMLQPWANGWSGKAVDEVSIDIAEPVTRVTLKVPAPP